MAITKDRRYWGDDRRISISDPRFDVTKHRSLNEETRLQNISDQGKYGEVASTAEEKFTKDLLR
jgi:hypothetical protein